MVIVKIIKVRHSKGHISQTNHDLKNILCKNTVLLLYLYEIFIFLLGHLHFFLHFFLSFMENLFKKHPIPSHTCRVVCGSICQTLLLPQKIPLRPSSRDWLRRRRMISNLHDCHLRWGPFLNHPLLSSPHSSSRKA